MSKHIHILGIAGTFMGGIAAIAKAAGFEVTGSDLNVYPPMSTQLKSLGIDFVQGYGAEQLDLKPDIVVVGNALSRGAPVVEAMLDRGIPYTSGPLWLAEQVLHERHVIAVTGTHGKTTTTSMLTWILEHAGLEPGFLVGGVPSDFNSSARLGSSRYFVIEADEYDTAFFDKRAKFVHYRPRTAILNNLEYDHADIYPDVASIRRQFNQLLRTVPGAGRLIVNGQDAELSATLKMGCWTPQETFGMHSGDWTAQIEPGLRGRQVRRVFQRRAGGNCAVEFVGRAQCHERVGSHRRRSPRGRESGTRGRGIGHFSWREAPHGGARRGGRHYRVRRFRTPPHRYRDDGRGPPGTGRQGAHHRSGRAALEHHEVGRAS